MRMKMGQDDDFIVEDSPYMEHTLEKPIPVHYNPPDGELNFWMFAMIGMGCAFIIFVIGSIYLMCKNEPQGSNLTPRRRQTKASRNVERVALAEHL